MNIFGSSRNCLLLCDVKSNYFKMSEEIKNRIKKEFEGLRAKSRSNDPVVDFLKGHMSLDINFSSNLRMLPYDLVELYGPHIIQDKKEFEKYFDPNNDIFNLERMQHYHGYLGDILNLIEDYQKISPLYDSPLGTFNTMSDKMIKIGRRRFLLDPQPKYPKNIVEQKQKRLDGSEKDYKFSRVYYIDDDGSKKRMIARHISDRYLRVEQEIADLFHHRGFAVHREYRSANGKPYDMVIERAGMKIVVEVKKIGEGTFNDLFIFDELQKRFNQDYQIN